jgi:hypothetical protein
MQLDHILAGIAARAFEDVNLRGKLKAAEAEKASKRRSVQDGL